MEAKIKRIGVLTSGGDSPGMNAAIRAVIRTAAYHNIESYGIRHGYSGLLNGEILKMEARDVGETLQKGGTILQTARCLEFKEKEGVMKGVAMAKRYGLDGIVVIGGDGSFRGARELTRAGIPTVAIPGTIDNDIACSDYTIGFDTCLETVKDSIDKLRDTSSSHDRCSIVEVMGRNAGYIAVHASIACGAEVVLIPEREVDFDRDVISPILNGKARGKHHIIVIVAEGVSKRVMPVQEMAKVIEDATGIEARSTVIGHVQRGGSPTVRDRVVASEMGAKAVELLLEGKSNRIVRMKDNKISDVDIEEGLNMTKDVEDYLIELSKKLSV